ncbi:MAG: hypothetical protein CMP21_01450 [Rickettsiales bacterium]|nr:hypothetical protein [Rickettsiales bacterium]|tara:strand:- start:4673 stop:6034 length:1362 start_codon:yes stop_codon:yes gene_type:complete
MIEQNNVNHLIKTIKQALMTENNSHLGIKRVAISYTFDEINIHAWLRYSNNTQTRYIKSQAQNTETLTLGSAKQWNYQSNHYQQAKISIMPWLNKGFNIYSAMMFQALDHNKDSLWNDLAEMTFIIPAIEMVKTETSITLWCNCPIEIADQSQHLDSYLNDAFSYHNNLSIPKLTIDQITSLPKYSEWENSIKQVLNAMKQSSLKKLVLARKTTVEIIDHHSMIELVSESIKNEPNCNIYFQKINTTTAFLSVTPENLYLRKGNHIQCDAIAGTTSKGSTSMQTKHLAQSLLNSHKNIAEHQYVAEYIKESLIPLCQSIKITKEKNILELSYLQHIHSVIEGKLKTTITDFELLETLHPTPATGGLPKSIGLDLIANIESFNRGLYTGALGMISHNITEFFVGIRSCLMQDNKLFIYTGAGIVADSNALDEWQELDIKMESYLSMTYDISYQQ